MVESTTMDASAGSPDVELNGGAWALHRAGVEVVFALPGGHLDSFLTGCRRFGIDLVDGRHEAAAVNAADGNARTTGRLDNVVTSTAAVNLITTSMLGDLDAPVEISIPYYDNIPE